MSNLINTGTDFIELDPATMIYKRHPIQFSQAGIHIVKLTKDAQGKETPVFIIPKRMLKVDATGEILEEKRGFDMNSEIIGPPTGYVQVNESDIPDTFDDRDAEGKRKHKYSKVTKGIKLK